MKLHIRMLAHACAVVALIGALPSRAADATTPIERVIAGTAKKSGKKFIVHPGVQANVTLVGLDPDNLDYPTLLSVLDTHGFTAVDDGKYVRVLPEVDVRSLPIPLVVGDESRPNAEYVSRVIAVKNVPASQLVPLLRPLLPKQSHLVALPCTNTLMMIDTFGNVKRIEKLVATLDTGTPYKPESCSPQLAAKGD